MTGTSIFIVEDEAIVANDISETLKALGYTVAGIAKSGELAVERVTEIRPDLVLMDIHLAGEMDGITAAGKIKTLSDIPVIYLTAYADKDLLNRAKITEPYGYILKPYDERELHSVIEMALYKHRIEMEIRKRDAILFAVSSAVEWMLRILHEKIRKDEHKDIFNEAEIREILEPIGLAVCASSIGIFALKPDGNGSTLLSMKYEWTATGVAPNIYRKDWKNLPSPPGPSRWYGQFRKGEIVNETLESLPDPERWFFKTLNVRSGIMLPVVARDSLWGFIGFFSSAERQWSVEEIESLRITANLLRAAMG
jgi:CheY-like chemotaxis protein